jgi:hypothetical protein
LIRERKEGRDERREEKDRDVCRDTALSREREIKKRAMGHE